MQRIENKTPEDNAKIEERNILKKAIEAEKTRLKETITPDYIEKEIAPKVGEVLFDIDAKKLT